MSRTFGTDPLQAPYVPAPKEFLRYADWRYYEPTIYTQNLLRFLMREAEQSASIAADTVSEIVTCGHDE